MRSFFYSIVFVSILGFGFFISSKSLASGEPVSRIQPKLPYEVVEVLPGGKENHINGGSSSYEPTTIIGDLSLPYNPEDKVYVFPDPKLGIGSTIKLLRAPIISVKDGKRSKDYRSWVSTVGDLFAEKNIEIGADDKVSASLNSEIFNGSQIVITRVAITNVVETKAIDFKVIKKEDPNLDKGKTRISVTGVKGEKQLTYRVTREDGDEVSRVLTDTTITKEPIDQIEYFGTKPVITVRCKYNDTVLAASIKYKQDPNTICNLMMKESNGNAGSVNPNGYYGLFQYELGLWASASAKAGYAGSDWINPTAQIYTTCYLFSVGQSWRW